MGLTPRAGWRIMACVNDRIMKVTINQKGKAYEVVLEGRLDTTTAPKFQEDITPLMQAAQAEIVLDCAQLEYTSSQGLRLFLMLQKSVMKNGGSLVMKNMIPPVKEVFDITGFSNIINIQ